MAKSGYDHTMNNNNDQNKFSQQKHLMFTETSTDLLNHHCLNGYKPMHKYLDDTIMANSNNGNKTMISSDNNSVLIQDYNTSNNNNNNMNINSNQNTNHHNTNQDITSSKTLNKLSASSLTTTLARNLINNNKSNSYSNMNGGPAASFRKKITNNNSYMKDSLSHHPNQVSSSQTNQPPKVTAMTTTKGQRYMANISNTANLMANKQQQQQPLLNLSILESPSSVANGQQTSPMNISNETTSPTNVGGVGCSGVQAATLLSSSTLPQLAAQSSSSMKMNPLLHSTAADIATIVQHSPNSSSFCLGNYCHNGIGELLASLALMCILSLLMAFLALSFIQRSYSISLSSGVEPFTTNNNHTSQKHNRMGGGSIIGGSSQAQYNQRIVSNAREYMKVFQISVSLSTLTIALDLCCLFVCCIQFLSIIKLLKTPFGVKRSFVFIKKTSHIRVISIGAFLISIPIFFAGVILYTFVNFDEIPALITSVIIGIGIIFCGVASVQNVYLWQWEKTKASQDMKLCQQQHLQQQQQQQQQYSHQNLQPAPSSFLYGNGQSTANMTANNSNLNNALYPLELSTLV